MPAIGRLSPPFPENDDFTVLSQAELLKVARSAGKEFDDEAVKAVNRWRFRPATCDGTPITAHVDVEVSSHR